MPVVLETSTHQITGVLRLPCEGYRSRLTDYLNAPEQRFIPLTEAEVSPLEGAGETVRHGFLLVAVDRLVLARPANGHLPGD